jgi:hypothetical protein
MVNMRVEMMTPTIPGALFGAGRFLLDVGWEK